MVVVCRPVFSRMFPTLDHLPFPGRIPRIFCCSFLNIITLYFPCSLEHGPCQPVIFIILFNFQQLHPFPGNARDRGNQTFANFTKFIYKLKNRIRRTSTGKRVFFILERKVQRFMRDCSISRKGSGLPSAAPPPPIFRSKMNLRCICRSAEKPCRHADTVKGVRHP